MTRRSPPPASPRCSTRCEPAPTRTGPAPAPSCWRYGAIGEARRLRLFRCDHLTHLRCEISSADVVPTAEDFAARHEIGLLSLMDHTPGQRQFRDLDKYCVYSARSGRSPGEIRAFAPRKMVEQPRPRHRPGGPGRDRARPARRPGAGAPRRRGAVVRQVWRGGERVA
jgi:hypothetical protein